MLLGRFFLRQRGSGLQVRDTGSCVYTVLDGKIARVEMYRDHQQALQAAGVTDAPPQPADTPQHERSQLVALLTEKPRVERGFSE